MQSEPSLFVIIKGYFGSFSRKAVWVIIILGFLVFLPSLGNGFLGDDNAQVVDNILIRSPKNIPSFFAGGSFYLDNSKLAGVYYKPLTLSVYAVLYSIFRLSPAAFHFFQIIFHILNAILIFYIFKRFFNEKISLVAALIFLVHPINSASVFYVSNFQEVLFFFFGALGFWFLSRPGYLNSVAAVIYLSLSLLSKETGLLFIIISLIYLLIYKRDNFFRFLAQSLMVLSVYLTLKICAVGLITNPKNTNIALLSLGKRLLNFPEIILFYIRKFVFPVTLVSSNRWVYLNLSFRHFFLPLIIDLVVLGAGILVLILIQKKKPEHFRTALFFGSWLLLGLLFHSQVIPLDFTVSERWFYFPIVGALGLIAAAWQILNFKNKQKALMAFVVAVIALFSARTFIRGFDWKNDETLITKDFRYLHDDYAVQDYLATKAIKNRDLNSALNYANKSVALFPYFTNHNTLGGVYYHLKNYDQAQKTYLEGLNYGDYQTLYKNLAVVTILKNDMKNDAPMLEELMRKGKQSPWLYLGLAVLKYNSGNEDEAKTLISKAYETGKNDEAISYAYLQILNSRPLELKFNTEFDAQ
ncbi:MAG: glycosyltransferase family 39 protein [Acidobacteriaceae bacterium]